MSTLERSCWCGYPTLFPYSHEYHVCKACGTLVSCAPVTLGKPEANEKSADLYSEEYWLSRQREHHKLPDIHQRSRSDLPERCTYWLQHLLNVQLPPARILELGCGHGAYLSLLGSAGFHATGTEMSPWVVDFAKQTFGVNVRLGPIETQNFEPASFEVIVLNDVIEHLPRPLETLTLCANLLTPDGVFVLQTPEYKEHLTYEDLKASNDLFLKHMTNNNEEHLYLFSRRSAKELFQRIGFPAVEFSNPFFAYDMFFTASRSERMKNSAEKIWQALSRRPEGRLTQALLDKAFESTDRWWEIQRLREKS